MRGCFCTTYLNPNKNLRAYVVGLAIGDGNLSNPNGRAICLRITCDKKYPLLIKKIFNSLKNLLPENKVGVTNRKNSGCVDVRISSNHLENLLGWRAANGSKFLQKVSVPKWIKENNEYKTSCLRGLIETDGCIYSDRTYHMVNFSTIIPNLANDVYNMINSLGFKSHIYKIKRGANKYNLNQKVIYRIRLSKNVPDFLDLVRPEKN